MKLAILKKLPLKKMIFVTFKVTIVLGKFTFVSLKKVVLKKLLWFTFKLILKKYAVKIITFAPLKLVPILGNLLFIIDVIDIIQALNEFKDIIKLIY